MRPLFVSLNPLSFISPPFSSVSVFLKATLDLHKEDLNGASTELDFCTDCSANPTRLPLGQQQEV